MHVQKCRNFDDFRLFRSELNLIGEQLAQQHAMVTRLQKTDSNWEQLCAERIAEQQLRIKQVIYSVHNHVLIISVFHNILTGKDSSEVDGCALLHSELSTTSPSPHTSPPCEGVDSSSCCWEVSSL